MKLFFAALIITLTLIGCMSQEGLETATVKANTMVCEMCSKNVKEAVFAVEGVKSVDVDMKEKIVTVKFVSAQTNLQTVERAITDAGYDANDKKRDSAAYEKLDACCKIDG